MNETISSTRNEPVTLFDSTPENLPAPVAIMRATLAILLATMRLNSPDLLLDDELESICQNCGVWPVPRGRESQLRALLYVGPGLMVLFAGAPVEHRHAFEQWKRALAVQDTRATAHWLQRLHLWPTQASEPAH